MILFKLKKNDKTVGYLEMLASDGSVVYRKDLLDDFECEFWEQEICEFDEALAYVRDDNNGDKAFVGDKVKMRNPSNLEWDIEGIIMIPKDILAPFIRAGHTNWSIFNDIKLIKENKNGNCKNHKP